MKNKKGFTLIELLVVIALMLSILGIAVVSLMNTSNKKKKESWEQVKGQIETAAEEYVNTNSYMFEGLGDDVTGKISVGTLVNEDFLNKITNPKTGKSISFCTIINIGKSGNKYTAKLDENTIYNSDTASCEKRSLITVSEPGAPTGTVKYYDSNNQQTSNNGWFNLEKLHGTMLRACIDANTNNNGPILNAMINGNDAIKDGNSYCININDGKYSKLKFTLTNSSGKSWISYDSVYKDTVRPVGSVTIRQKDSWASKDVLLDLTASDDVSGISTFKIGSEYFNGVSGTTSWTRNGAPYQFQNTSYDGSTKSLTGIISDVAGNTYNTNVATYTLYKSCMPSNIVDNGSWYNSGSCTTKCGGNGQKQLKNTKDVNSNDSCTQQERYAYCGGTQNASSSTYCNASRCSTGNYVTKTNLVSSIDSNTSCGAVEVVGESCGGTKVGTDAKAYKWEAVTGDTKHCQINNSITLTGVGGGSHTYKGPYRKYKFTEITCSCNIDSRDNKYCSYSGYTDITSTTHRNENGYYSYIIYNNNNAGLSSCNSEGRSKNTNVQRICINGGVSSSLEYHGWYWYSGGNPTRYERDTKTFQSGWFVNGSQKDIYPVTDSVESVCAKACASKY